MVGRLLTLALGLCLLLGCAPPSAETSTTGADPSATTSVDPATTSSTAELETTTSAGDTTTTSGRPLAPDFTLRLGDGGTYTLSEGSRPVYLVFWAEW